MGGFHHDAWMSDRGMSLDHYSRPRMMMKEDSLDPNGGKRKRFTEDQLNALQKLAEEAQWSLVSVPREARDKFCSEWEITKARSQPPFQWPILRR